MATLSSTQRNVLARMHEADMRKLYDVPTWETVRHAYECGFSMAESQNTKHEERTDATQKGDVTPCTTQTP